jgi:hypothetical protein
MKYISILEIADPTNKKHHLLVNFAGKIIKTDKEAALITIEFFSTNESIFLSAQQAFDALKQDPSDKNAKAFWYALNNLCYETLDGINLKEFIAETTTKESFIDYLQTIPLSNLIGIIFALTRKLTEDNIEVPLP